jgi:preprotein translocase subunit SecD
MRSLTTQNKPNSANPVVYRHLGIVLEKKLISAPSIITTISDRASVSGGSMTERDVDDVVNTLNAGSMPRAVRLVEETRTGDKQPSE